MSYIIVWRNTRKDPFVDVDSHGFIETFPSESEARKTAKEAVNQENKTEMSPWYFDYKIYKEC